MKIYLEREREGERQGKVSFLLTV